MRKVSIKSFILLILTGGLVSTSAMAVKAVEKSDAKDLARAERVIEQLHLLDASIAEQRDEDDSPASVKKISSKLQSNFSHLPEGDLKTHLTTAFGFYLAASTLRARAGALGDAPICENERPGAYRQLCLNAKDNNYQFTLRKARLRTKWAETLVNGSKERDDSTFEASLFEAQAERTFEQQLTMEAINSLQTLERDVYIYNSQAALEDGQGVGKTSVGEFRSKLKAESEKLAVIIRWLPENRVKTYIRNALQSYKDGLFWWEKTYHPKVINVASLSFSPRSRAELIGMNEQVVNYTIVINWREARNWTRKAEASEESSIRPAHRREL